MEGIPSIYWMVLISVFTGFVCFVLYQLAMLIQESKGAVSDARKLIIGAESTLRVVNEIVGDVNEMVSTVKGTVYKVNSAILIPIKKITTVLGVTSGILEGLSSRKEK